MTEIKRKTRPWVRRRRLLLAVFGCCVVLAAFLAWVSRRTDTAIEKQVAAIRVQGYPATVDDLKKAYPPPPKGENAEETLGKNFHIPHSMMQCEEEYILQKAWKTPARSRLAEQLRKKMDEYLSENEDTLRRLHEVAGKPLGRFPVDWGGGSAGPPFGLRSVKIRSAVNLLACEAIVSVEDGDVARAIESVVAQLNLGNTLRDELSCISQGERYNCHEVTCRVMQWMLDKDNLSDTNLKQLADVLRNEEDPEGMTRALVAERARFLTRCDQPRSWRSPEEDQYFPGSDAMLGWTLRTIVVYGGDLTFYLSAMAKLIEVSQHPTAQATLVGDHIQRELGTTRYFFSGLFIPKNPIRELACDQVCLRETMTAIAAERYRLANGKPAEGIGDLTPAFLDALPIDPFDGRPLRFRSEEGGYVLHSVGPNLADDNGAGDDIVFRVEHPA